MPRAASAAGADGLRKCSFDSKSYMPADGISAADGRMATSTRRFFLAALGQMDVRYTNNTRTLTLLPHLRMSYLIQIWKTIRLNITGCWGL